MKKIIKQNLIFIAIAFTPFVVFAVVSAYVDTGTYGSSCFPSPYQTYANFTVPFLFMLFVITAIGLFYEVKTLRNIYKVLMVLVLLLGSAGTISNILFLQDAKDRAETIDTLRFEMQEISLEQAGTIGDASGLFVLYVGRDNCPYCVDMKELLETVAENYPVQILYYNTINDRETRRDEMQVVLDKYGVTSVPTVLVFKWGVIEEIFQDYENPDAFIEIIESYREQGIYFTERQIVYLSEKYVW